MSSVVSRSEADALPEVPRTGGFLVEAAVGEVQAEGMFLIRTPNNGVRRGPLVSCEARSGRQEG